ncbi:hypothetical protein QQF64_019425 [Cirrhinus molitorella]|uniref:Uncharacterized protein n=1 Tax=Cirrhinus molitorella TaxID=172907 RepID=A0ABR3LFE9_9TELE
MSSFRTHSAVTVGWIDSYYSDTTGLGCIWGRDMFSLQETHICKLRRNPIMNTTSYTRVLMHNDMISGIAIFD